MNSSKKIDVHDVSGENNPKSIYSCHLCMKPHPRPTRIVALVCDQ